MLRGQDTRTPSRQPRPSSRVARQLDATSPWRLYRRGLLEHAVSCGSLGLIDNLCKTAILNISTDFCGAEDINFAHLGRTMVRLEKKKFQRLMYCDIDALVESANTVLAAKEKITPALLSKVFPLGKDSVRKLDARQIAEIMHALFSQFISTSSCRGASRRGTSSSATSSSASSRSCGTASSPTSSP